MTATQPGPTLTIEPDQLVGRTGRYEKRLGDLDGLYADADAFARLRAERGDDAVMYHVDEFRPSDQAGDLITGISTL
ncbi:glucose-6-phosphate isomerase family protein, partial [Aeromicrobium sp. Leaf272]